MRLTPWTWLIHLGLQLARIEDCYTKKSWAELGFRAFGIVLAIALVGFYGWFMATMGSEFWLHVVVLIVLALILMAIGAAPFMWAEHYRTKRTERGH